MLTTIILMSLAFFAGYGLRFAIEKLMPKTSEEVDKIIAKFKIREAQKQQNDSIFRNPQP